MCSVCSEHSPQVYVQGWFCTNGLCSKFSMVRFENFRIGQQLTRLVVVSRWQTINTNSPYLRGEFLARRSPSHGLWPRVGTQTFFLFFFIFFCGGRKGNASCTLEPKHLSVIPSTSHLRGLEAYSSAYWKGLCCPECGKLTCR